MVARGRRLRLAYRLNYRANRIAAQSPKLVLLQRFVYSLHCNEAQ